MVEKKNRKKRKLEDACELKNKLMLNIHHIADNKLDTYVKRKDSLPDNLVICVDAIY